MATGNGFRLIQWPWRPRAGARVSAFGGRVGTVVTAPWFHATVSESMWICEVRFDDLPAVIEFVAVDQLYPGRNGFRIFCETWGVAEPETAT